MSEHAPEDVEMVAKTLHAHTGRSARDFPWGHIDEFSRDYYRDNARRLLTRLDEARADRTNRASEHGPDWSDYSAADHPEEGPSCKCGFNGTPEECAADRTNGSTER